MPYGTLDALPDSVKSVLPKRAQEIFLAAYNTAYSDTCKNRSDREVCSNRIAWSAVKRQFEKEPDGHWKALPQKRQKTNCCKFGECHIQKSEPGPSPSNHDIILQLLNRKIGPGFFAVEPFEESVPRWEGVPIVFSALPKDLYENGMSSNHPDFEPFSPVVTDEELLRVNGAVVGYITDPRLETAGHPRLMGTLSFTPDKAKAMFDSGDISEETYQKTELGIEIATRLLDDGRLSPSTGFSCRSDDEGTLTNELPLIPNHLLVFEEDPYNMPRDPGSVILNKGGGAPVTPTPEKSEHPPAITEESGDDTTMNTEDTDKKGWLQRKLEEFTSMLFKNQAPAGSNEERSSLLHTAVNARYGTNDGGSSTVAYGAWIEATFDDRVIVRSADGKLYSVGYVVNDSGTVTFGESTEVEIVFQPKAQPKTTNKDDDMDEAMKTELEQAKATLANKDAELVALKSQVDTLTTELTEFRNQQKNVAWETEKKKLKAALVHKTEDEAAMKELFLKDPYAYMQKAEYIGEVPAKGIQSGDKFANKGDGKDAQSAAAIAGELRRITGRR